MKSARLKVVRGISTVALTAVISLASCRLACAKVTTVDSAGQTNVSEEDLIITSNVDYESLDVNLLEDDAMLAIFGEGNEPDIVTVKVKDLTFTGVAGAASNCLMIDSRGDLIVDGDVVFTTAYINLNAPADHTDGSVKNRIVFNGPVRLEGKGIGFFNANELVTSSIDSAVTTSVTFNGEVSGEGGIDVGYQGITLNNPSNSFTGDVNAVCSMITLRGPGSLGRSEYMSLDDSFLSVIEGGEFDTPIEIINPSTVNAQNDLVISSDIFGEGLYVGSVDGKTLSLEGDNSVTFMDVIWGRVDVNGDKTTQTFEGVGVNRGATLGGNGTIDEYVMNYGTISPGTVDEIGTLTIMDDCFQYESSVLSVRIRGEENDCLKVQGYTFFDASPVDETVKPAVNISIENPVMGKSYVILTSRGVYGTENVVLNVTESDAFDVEVAQDGRNLMVTVKKKKSDVSASTDDKALID